MKKTLALVPLLLLSLTAVASDEIPATHGPIFSFKKAHLDRATGVAKFIEPRAYYDGQDRDILSVSYYRDDHSTAASSSRPGICSQLMPLLALEEGNVTFYATMTEQAPYHGYDNLAVVDGNGKVSGDWRWFGGYVWERRIENHRIKSLTCQSDASFGVQTPPVPGESN